MTFRIRDGRIGPGMEILKHADAARRGDHRCRRRCALTGSYRPKCQPRMNPAISAASSSSSDTWRDCLSILAIVFPARCLRRSAGPWRPVSVAGSNHLRGPRICTMTASDRCAEQREAEERGAGLGHGSERSGGDGCTRRVFIRPAVERPRAGVADRDSAPSRNAWRRPGRARRRSRGSPAC